MKVQKPYICVELKETTSTIILDNAKDMIFNEVFCVESFDGAFCKKGDKLFVRPDTRMFAFKDKDKKEYKFIAENDILAVVD